MRKVLLWTLGGLLGAAAYGAGAVDTRQVRVIQQIAGGPAGSANQTNTIILGWCGDGHTYYIRPHGFDTPEQTPLTMVDPNNIIGSVNAFLARGYTLIGPGKDHREYEGVCRYTRGQNVWVISMNTKQTSGDPGHGRRWFTSETTIALPGVECSVNAPATVDIGTLDSSSALGAQRAIPISVTCNQASRVRVSVRGTDGTNTVWFSDLLKGTLSVGDGRSGTFDIDVPAASVVDPKAVVRISTSNAPKPGEYRASGVIIAEVL